MGGRLKAIDHLSCYIVDIRDLFVRYQMPQFKKAIALRHVYYLRSLIAIALSRNNHTAKQV
jgi:hypothetical protein